MFLANFERCRGTLTFLKMSPIDLHEGLNGLDAESLRSFSTTLPDDYHDWVSESGRTSR